MNVTIDTEEVGRDLSPTKYFHYTFNSLVIYTLSRCSVIRQLYVFGYNKSVHGK